MPIAAGLSATLDDWLRVRGDQAGALLYEVHKSGAIVPKGITPAAIYNVWGHAYSIRALVRLIEHREGDESRRAELLDLLLSQIDRLERYELVSGGWGYYDFEIGTQKPAGSPTSFTTATVLVALADARKVGVEVSRRLVERAAASIGRQRKPDSSYLYGEYLWWRPMRLVNRPPASLGRSQVCNLSFVQ